MSIALFDKRRRRKLASRRRVVANRAVVRYKVRRGEWRTMEQTAAILGLPAHAKLPAFVCKLPMRGLELMKEATASRMIGKEEAAAETFEVSPEPVN